MSASIAWDQRVQAVGLDPDRGGGTDPGRATPLRTAALEVRARECPSPVLASRGEMFAALDPLGLLQRRDRIGAVIHAARVDRVSVVALVHDRRRLRGRGSRSLRNLPPVWRDRNSPRAVAVNRNVLVRVGRDLGPTPRRVLREDLNSVGVGSRSSRADFEEGAGAALPGQQRVGRDANRPQVLGPVTRKGLGRGGGHLGSRRRRRRRRTTVYVTVARRGTQRIRAASCDRQRDGGDECDPSSQASDRQTLFAQTDGSKAGVNRANPEVSPPRATVESPAVTGDRVSSKPPSETVSFSTGFATPRVRRSRWRATSVGASQKPVS